MSPLTKAESSGQIMNSVGRRGKSANTNNAIAEVAEAYLESYKLNNKVKNLKLLARKNKEIQSALRRKPAEWLESRTALASGAVRAFSTGTAADPVQQRNEMNRLADSRYKGGGSSSYLAKRTQQARR